MDVCYAGRLVDLILRCAAAAESDILADGFGKQEWFLHHHTELCAQPFSVQVAQLAAFQRDAVRTAGHKVATGGARV
jgi:hypothetical protein